ncbi:DUF4403 family protein [Sphingomonas sp. CJ99]
MLTGRWHILILAIAILLAGCERQKTYPKPPRFDAGFTIPEQSSSLNVPVRFDLDALEAELNRQTPRTLWSIDERTQCAAPQRLTVCLKHERPCKGKACRDVPCKVGFKRAKVTPAIGCRIVGQVVRGTIRLSGRGDRMALSMPVKATIQARDIGGILKQETATGAAIVRATARLDIDQRWEPTARIDIDYDWTEPPGIDFLGQRIRFARRADEKLVGVVRQLERDLPRSLPRGVVRKQVEAAWKSGFTVIQLNRERPPAWMRVTPQALGFAGYRISGRTMEAWIAAQGLTQTFLGDAPAAAQPTPLPPPIRQVGKAGLRFHIPVLADYDELKPPLKRALGRLAARKSIEIDAVGPVKVAFGDVEIFPTDNGRIAVGVDVAADVVRGPLAPTRGRVWLTAIPVSAEGSQIVKVRDLQIFGQSERGEAVDLLIRLFLTPIVQSEIERSLTLDFNKDYEKVLAAARKAIAERREGDFLGTATIDRVRHGPVQVTGQGLFMLTDIWGTGSVRYVQ